MKKIILSICILFIVGNIFAQKKELSLKDAVLGLKVDNLKQLQWQGDLEVYTQILENSSGDEELIATNIIGETNILVKLSDLENASISKNGFQKFPRYSWINNEIFQFNSGNSTWIYNVYSKKLIKTFEFPEKAENRDIHDSFAAYTIDDDLYISQGLNKKTRVSADGGNGIVYGKAVHRFEFGISKGTFWSPKNSFLAFYKKDESMVTDYPLVDAINEKPAKSNNIKYPMAGMKSHHVQIGIYNVQKESIIYLKTGEPKEQYLTNISWSPDEKFIYVAIVNRAQNEMKLNQYDVKTGNFVKTLFIEKHPKYVEPEHKMLFLPENNAEFLWFSERDGFNHLYHYNSDGKLINQITKGKWLVNEFLGFSEKSNKIFITASKAHPLEKHAYQVDLKSLEIKKITNNSGTHFIKICKSGNFALDSYSSDFVPRDVNLINIKKGEIEETLFEAPNPLKKFKIGEVQSVELKAKSGDILYGKLMLPADFNPQKKYPVIVYLYGGPHYQLVRNRFPASGNLWYNYMNQKGFIVFTMDNRGSSNRGLEFEQATFRQLGKVEMDDQLAGIDFLTGLDFVDKNRIGVHGWSFGGFMTTSLMTNYPEVFKVGVAGGPVIDWRFYEIMYTERYMDTPEENPEGYKATDLKNKAKNLEGRLLMIHGAQDDVVVWQHSLSFVRQCVKDGVLLDYFVYPTHPHNVRGKDRIHLMGIISRYFEDHL